MNRIKVIFALGAMVVVLANQSCSRGAEGQARSAPASQSLTTPGTLPGISLRVDLYPTALPGQPFGVEVSFRNSIGQLMNVSDLVTLNLVVNPTAAVLHGTLTRAAVNGVASFPDLVVDNVGRGYGLVASSIQGGTATSAAFAIAYSEDEDASPAVAAGVSPASARAISPNVPKFRTLGAGEVHYYRFHAKVGQLLSVASYANRIDMRDWDTSLRIRLLAPDGTTEIARSGAANRDARGVDNGIATVRIPQEGDYYLACDVDQAGFLSGVYALVISLSPNLGPLLQIESEPWGVTGQNDTPATAQALLPGLLYGHYDNGATSATSADYYKIAILVPSRIRIDLQVARNGAAYGDRPFDSNLTLQTSTGAALWWNDNTYGSDPMIDYIVTKPGTYYVRVGSSGGGSSPYFLSYVPSPYLPTAETAGNSTLATATPIRYGGEVSGSFSAAGDHFFAFGGAAGDVVRLVAEDQSQLQAATLTLNAGAGGDAVLLASDGTQLSASVGSGTSTESRLNTRQTILQATGTCFVRVRSAAAGRFGFRLDRVAASGREVEPNDTAAQATPIGPTGWISGTISTAGDKDHFRVHAEAGQLVTVSLLAAPGGGLGNALADWGSALMPVLEVHNLQGDLLSVTSADRKGETNFAESLQHPLVSAIGGGLPMLQTTFHSPASADYDIVVSDADGQGGANYFYALHAWRNQ